MAHMSLGDHISGENLKATWPHQDTRDTGNKSLADSNIPAINSYYRRGNINLGG